MMKSWTKTGSRSRWRNHIQYDVYRSTIDRKVDGWGIFQEGWLWAVKIESSSLVNDILCCSNTNRAGRVQ